MTLSGSERLVIICGLADGGEGFVVLKELKARVAGDCGGIRGDFRNRSRMHRRLRLPVLRRVGNGCNRTI
jgi:hypothetical protein